MDPKEKKRTRKESSSSSSSSDDQSEKNFKINTALDNSLNTAITLSLRKI
jgi:hypothetical protein